MSSFHLQFRAKLKAAGMNQSDFAKAVGVSPATISRILTGGISLPVDQVEAWANALSLTGDARGEFLDCISIFASPPRVQALVRAQRDRISELEEIAEKCKRRMAKIRTVLGNDDA